MKKKMMIFLFFAYPFFLFPNELINSSFDNYYEYLELSGDIESPVIFFHSFSNNRWPSVKADHPWESYLDPDRSLVKNDSFSLYINDPDLLFSVNSAEPKGFNDGAMWQGKGLNGSLSGGLSFDSEYFEATFYPQIWFAQNLAFDYLQSHYSNPEYGYFNGSLDYPQRLGDVPFFDFSWGQTDIRFKYRSFTVGLSTENIWIGPAEQNALILSNNADGFPHFDIGIRKTETKIGFFEARYWLGLLIETDYYNTDPDDDYRLYHGLSASYSPSFLPGLSLGANWVINSPGGKFNASYFFPHFLTVIGQAEYMGADDLDQKISLMAEWKFPKVGFSTYVEWAREDFSPGPYSIAVYPGHTEFYTLGFKKTLPLDKHRGFLLSAELSELIQSRDYEIDLGAGGNYYTHGYVLHGYTNKGQILGASIGPGSDSQYISLEFFDAWGKIALYFRRISWDKMYLFQNPVTIPESKTDPALEPGKARLNVELTPGVKADLFLGHFNLYGDINLSYILNQNYIAGNHIFNFYMNLGVKYRF